MIEHVLEMPVEILEQLAVDLANSTIVKELEQDVIVAEKKFQTAIEVAVDTLLIEIIKEQDPNNPYIFPEWTCPPAMSPAACLAYLRSLSKDPGVFVGTPPTRKPSEYAPKLWFDPLG